MLKRTHKVALMAVLTVVMVLAFAGVALAQWTDISLSVVGPYGITEEQLGQISQGFVDGSWGPYQQMPRKQFVKMAVAAYKIPLYSPATPTYTDVPATDYYYAYVEAATKAGLTNGVGGGKFEPNGTITREQAAAIIVRWVAAKNGYNLATYYTDAEAAAIIGAFPDAAQVGPSLLKEMAFAIDFGIIWGTDTGTLAPKGNLWRIQGAAMLIRSWGILPFAPPVNPPAKIELVGGDKSENLIGLAHTVTFKVTDAAGAPVEGALVDFDTLMAGYYYVGNISPAAGLTDAAGLAKCILLSTEPGTERVSATVNTPAGPKIVLTTKYWVVLDEVYILSDTRTAQNNVGTTHDWEARVVIFGPGPLSTSAQDWYNAVSLTADPTKPAMELDGVDWPVGWAIALLNQGYQYLLPVPGTDDWGAFFMNSYDLYLAWVDANADLLASDPNLASLINSLLAVDRWSNNTEQLMLALGYKPRTMAGVPVTWTIIPVSTDPSTGASVGTITAVEHTGTIATGGKSAVGYTDADGQTQITITSTATGKTNVMAVADYAGNPYPEKLFNHLTSNLQLHFLDWDDQPLPQATAIKTWIPHTEGGPGDTKISPAFSEPNIGEELLLTLTLKDEFGNAITDKQVEWYMQGVGQFKSDDDQTMSGDGLPFTVDKDIDVTDAAGTARVLVKSLDPGEQIVHAKFRDKGINNQEGMWKEYVAEVQWFKVAIASFDKPSTSANEAVSTNEVGTDHLFDFWVYGLKLEYFSTLLSGQGALTQVSWIDTDVSGKSYDGVMDADDAKYLDPNGILIVNEVEVGGVYNPANGKVDGDVYVDDATGIALGAGGITKFDFDGDGVKETAADMKLATGIYLPLQNKGVTFFMRTSSSTDPWNLNWATPVSDVGSIKAKGVGGTITYAGVSFTYDAITDAAGHAFVTVTSNLKGGQWVDGIVDYPANPAKGNQRVAGRSWKTWTTQANPEPSVKVTVNGIDVKPGGEEGPNPVLDAFGDLSYAHIAVHVLDAFGNELPDYEVVYEIVGNGQWLNGTQNAADTYHPLQQLMDNTPFGEQQAAASLTDRYPKTGTPTTNSALNQTFEKLTNIGTGGKGSFSATMPTASGLNWGWEFTASGLTRLPVTQGTTVINTYSLWLDNGGVYTKLANFNTDATGVIVGSKIFGAALPGLITATTKVWVTGENLTTVIVPTTGAWVLGGAVTITGVLDGNGTRPDNSEPRNDPTFADADILFLHPLYDGYQDGVGPDDAGADGPDFDWADPLAKIVGPGGTEAYYFDRFDPTGEQFDDFGTGAKAWTLDGNDPTTPHGSSVDVQLLENPYTVAGVTATTDVRCIINIQIYKPADGPVFDGTPWRTFEVQKVWAPVTRPTLDLAPDASTNPLGTDHTVTATLLTAAGVAVPNVTVNFVATQIAGDNTVPITIGSAVTGTDGKAYGRLTAPSLPGTYQIVATATVDTAIVTSDTVTKTWARRVATNIALANDATTATTVTNLITNSVGATHQVDATVTDQFGTPIDATVTFTWHLTGGTGIADQTTAAIHGATGVYTTSWVGPGTPSTYSITATAPGANASNSVTKIWATLVAGSISLTQDTYALTVDQTTVPVYNPVDTDHTVTAIVRDQYGTLLQGATVTFVWDMSSAPDRTATAVTNGSGVATDHTTGATTAKDATITATVTVGSSTLTSIAVVKHWYTPVVTSILLQRSQATGTKPYSRTSPDLTLYANDVWGTGPMTVITANDPTGWGQVDFRGRFIDQLGNPMWGGELRTALPNTYKLMITNTDVNAPPGTKTYHANLTPYAAIDLDGWMYFFGSEADPDVVTYRIWIDANDDDVIQSTEVKSNDVVVTFNP